MASSIELSNNILCLGLFLLPAILFCFEGLCCFAQLMFFSEELSFTPAAEIQNKASKKLSSFLPNFLPLFSFSLQESSFMPRQQNYSLFHVIDSNEPFFFQCHFSLSLNPFFLLGQYSPLSLLSICLALRLAHRSCLLFTYEVSPVPAQVLLSSSATSSHKMLGLTGWPGKKTVRYITFQVQF